MTRIDFYDKDVALNAVLYILQKFGGESDMHKVFKTLYFADMAHMSKYGSSITGDAYFAMAYGPVPSKTYDIFKAIKGTSFFSDSQLNEYLSFKNDIIVVPKKKCDKDYLSDSAVECLDEAIAKCDKLGFKELTDLSHGYAWHQTGRDKEISIRDILTEAGDSKDYVDYVVRNAKEAKLVANGFAH